jgi:hypothetical protein
MEQEMRKGKIKVMKRHWAQRRLLVPSINPTLGPTPDKGTDRRAYGVSLSSAAHCHIAVSTDLRVRLLGPLCHFFAHALLWQVGPAAQTRQLPRYRGAAREELARIFLRADRIPGIKLNRAPLL